MKIYTKKGDQGMTSLLGGNEVSKSHLRIESYGTVDELNSWIGVVSAFKSGDGSVVKTLACVQDRLFVIGSLLACEPGKKIALPRLAAGDCQLLEKEIDAMTAKLPELKTFLLPGGSEAGAFCHVARSVCRRAERLVVELAAESPVDAEIMVYLNRLSDYLFVLARKLNQDHNMPEVAWRPIRK